MNLRERITVLTSLGEYLRQSDERLHAHMHRASVDNQWFTMENVQFAVKQIGGWLTEEQLLYWTKGIKDEGPRKRVGVIMAGNIPAVGFHDLLCVFVSGDVAVIKLSDKDKILIPYFLKILGELDSRTSAFFETVDKLTDIDAVIATGSNNSARYFEYYFGKYPNIIRHNRNAVAILHGDETEEQLSKLCDDIFLYFGLGCRSVSHCFVPTGYSFENLVRQTERFNHLANHNKYRNNLDYNLALHMLNRSMIIGLPNLLLLENPGLISPVSCLHYSFYDGLDMLKDQLLLRRGEIQCVVTAHPIDGLPCVGFGEAQMPRLDDYADGIDTLAFLQNLN